MAADDCESLVLLLAWGCFAAHLRGEVPRDFSPVAVRGWLESGSPLAAKRTRDLEPEQRSAWLDEVAWEVLDVLERLCAEPEEGQRAGASVPASAPPKGAAARGYGPGRPCFLAFPVGPDPYVPECARCLWPRIGECGGRAA